MTTKLKEGGPFFLIANRDFTACVQQAGGVGPEEPRLYFTYADAVLDLDRTGACHLTIFQARLSLTSNITAVK